MTVKGKIGLCEKGGEMSDAAKRKAAVLNKADAVSQVSECEAAGKL